MGLMAAGAAAVGLAGCGDDTSCGAGTVKMGDTCVTELECAAGTTQMGNECVPDGSVVCGAGTTYNEDTGVCDPDVSSCGEGLVLDDAGNCVDPSALWDPDVIEPAEPNGFAGTPGEFTLPAEGSTVTLGGCINPVDEDDDGAVDADFDAFTFEAGGPMVLDVTVEGTGGLSGGFAVVPTDDQLVAIDWIRFGLNLVDATSQRELYLPKAGTYALAVTDGRSLFLAPTGNPDACYLATVEVKPTPAPKALVDGAADGMLSGVQLFSYDADDGDLLFTTLTAPGEAVLGDVVTLVNGEFVSGAGFGDRSNGSDAAAFADGLSATDELVIVVDPVMNYGLDVASFELVVNDPGAQALPADGTVTVQSDGDLFRWMYFDAAAGDVLELDFDSTAGSYALAIAGPGLTFVTEPCPLPGPFGGGGCSGALEDFFVQLPADGTYYVRLFDLSAPQPESFDVTATFSVETPTVLELDTAIDDRALGANNAQWFEFDAGASDWVFFTADAANLDGALGATLFDRDAVGALGADVPVTDTFTIDGDEVVDRLLTTDDNTYLVRVSDTGTFDAAATFDFTASGRTFTDLGMFDDATPIAEAGVTVTADSTSYFLAQGPVGELAQLAVTPTGFDAAVEIYGPSGFLREADFAGADAAEIAYAPIGDGANQYVAFAIRNDGGADGTTDIGIATIEPGTATGTSEPDLAIPDDGSTPVSDTLTVADACTVVGLSVDVDISHTFISDLVIVVESPDGTTLTLHGQSGGSADDIVGTYPDDLTPVDDLNAVVGEAGTGTWTMTILDTFAADSGTLNSWGVNLLCEP